MILEHVNSEEKIYDLLMEAEANSANSNHFNILEGISFDAYQLSNEMGEYNDKSFFSKVHKGILFTALLIFIIHIFFMGYWLGIFGTVIVLFFHARSKVKISKAIYKVKSEKPAMGNNVFLEKQHIFNFLNYLYCGILLKETRISILQSELSILLPIMVMCGTELILSRIGILEMALGVVIGILTWFFIFQNDYEKVFDFQDRLEDMEDKLSKL